MRPRFCCARLAHATTTRTGSQQASGFQLIGFVLHGAGSSFLPAASSLLPANWLCFAQQVHRLGPPGSDNWLCFAQRALRLLLSLRVAQRRGNLGPGNWLCFARQAVLTPEGVFRGVYSVKSEDSMLGLSCLTLLPIRISNLSRISRLRFRISRPLMILYSVVT